MADRRFVCCALCLLIPPLGVVALVIGILALVRGRIGAGIALVLLGTLLPFAGAVILQSFILKPYRMPSESMAPTLVVGDRILVWRASSDPQLGDIVVFHPPAGAESAELQCGARQRRGQACPRPTAERSEVSFIKRIVAGPDDRIAIVDGHVVLNGKRQTEPFISACGDGAGCDFTRSITIPPDHYFMMGDNRGASDDSRFWGPVPADWFVGRAFVRYWPGGRLGGI